MSTISVIDNAQEATLKPGFYWIEMAFDRPASEETFLRALRTIGFDSAMLEHQDEGARDRVGALAVNTSTSLSSAAAGPSVGPSAIQSASIYREPAAAPAPAPAPAPVPYAAAVAAAAAAAGPSLIQAASIYRPPSGIPIPSRSSGGTGDSGGWSPPPPPPVNLTCESYDQLTQETWDALTAAEQNFYLDCLAKRPPIEATPPPGGGGGGGGYDGGGGGGGYQWQEGDGSYGPPDPGQGYDYGSPGPAPRKPSESREIKSYTLPAPQPPVPGAVIIPGAIANWWLCPPGTTWKDVKVSGRGMIVGGEVSPGGSSFRFLGQLAHAIDIKALPGLRWTIVHAVGFDPWGPMSFRLTPHPLEHGQLYDLRFLSRDKTAKTKKDVLALLTDMGFRPATIFLSKRNMRIPGRPLTTLSEWFGVGIWTGPDSVIVSSDPFYFAEVRPTT